MSEADPLRDRIRTSDFIFTTGQVMARILLQPQGATRLGDYLNSHLVDDQWSEFKAAIAFVKYSGVQHIEQGLRHFGTRGQITIAAGVDCQGSSVEGLSALLNAVRPRGEIWIFHNESNTTFHPKIYLFKSPRAADLIVGSGNLTAGGLFTNYEGSIALSLDLSQPADANLLNSVEDTLAAWCTEARGTARRLDEALLEALARHRYIVIEAQQPGEPDPDGARRLLARPPTEALFRRVPVRAAPAAARRGRRPGPPLDLVPATARAAVQGFVMTLQQTDAGYGQVRRGTARRSPEIFIPLGARDYSPHFWGWQEKFSEDTERPGKWDRREVRFRIGTQIAQVNMMTWPVKHDFRLRSEALRSAGNVGDILRREKIEHPVDYEYYAEIIPRGSTAYDYYLALCTEAAKGRSDKRWGYYL